MPRLLWVSAETPDIGGGGGQRRQFHQLHVLLQRGIGVHVAALEGLQDDASTRALTEVTRFRGRRLRGLLPTRELARIVERVRPDGIVAAHVESLPLLRGAAPGIPLLVDFHNVHSRYHADRGESPAAESWRVREADALRAASLSLACSDEEAAALRAHVPDARVEVAPHGVEPSEWPDSALAEEREAAAAFFGALTHTPNAEGLRWLVERVWPHVPDARLVVLGPGEPPLEAPRVEFAGRVDDLARALGGVRVVVVPIVSGVGARVKFVEGLASGAAVVSTSVGAEGFAADGAFVRADAPEAFARACVQLLRDSARAAELGRAGRAAALERFTWERTTEPLVRWAESL
jgi:polysaccharide biosynthesis protein PslH